MFHQSPAAQQFEYSLSNGQLSPRHPRAELGKEGPGVSTPRGDAPRERLQMEGSS